MITLRWNKLIGQDRVKSVIGGSFQSGKLAHAYLFCGERGAGKFAAAVDLAMAVLCRGSGGARPCGECSSCKRVLNYSHPDFHVIMPLVLSAAHKRDGGALSEEGWKFAAASARERIEDPYRLPRHGDIPHIPVDWIREADHAVNRGGTESGANAVILDGADTMRGEAANAMLKTLEEPPPGTVMILLTDKPHGVLPTVVSRCQIVRFAPLPPDVVAAELCDRFGVDRGDPRVEAAVACGSLGAAIEEFEDPHGEAAEAAAILWNSCARGDWEAAVRSAERASGAGESQLDCRQVVKSLTQLLRIAILRNFGAPESYINLKTPHPLEFPANVTPDDAERYAGLCRDALASLDARGNAAMVMASFVCALTDMLDGGR